MPGVPKSLVKENAREQLLSSDLNRMQYLASRDDQNLEAAKSRSFDSSTPNPSNPGNLLSVYGTPLYGLDRPPTFVFFAGYQVTIGDGAGFLWGPTFVGLSADDSSYLTMRWPSQLVTFANPHATLPRIDVVYATAAAADADSQSRTVLVDPVTRAITTQNLFKTSNPLSTLGVAAGTPGATPAVPAIPAHSIPLFYVWVVASAPTAATFGVCRAAWRRAPYPFAAMTGVIEGMGALWDQATTFAAVCPFIVRGFHRIVIDGELMEFYANMDSTVGGMAVDTGNNPFAVAAPATFNKPYYIYAVGGRNNPKPSFNTADGFLSPVTIVESLVPPDTRTGKPSANMTVGGTTITPAGAVYIGLGFVAMNTTNRAACFMDEAMTYCGVSTGNKIDHTWAGTATEQIGTLGNMPAISTLIAVVFNVLSTTAKLAVGLLPDRGGGAGNAVTWASISPVLAVAGLGATPFVGSDTGNMPVLPGNATFYAPMAIGDSATVWGVGFNHRVNRFGVSEF